MYNVLACKTGPGSDKKKFTFLWENLGAERRKSSNYIMIYTYGHSRQL